MEAWDEASAVLAVPAGATITFIARVTAGHCVARVEDDVPAVDGADGGAAGGSARAAHAPKKKALLPRTSATVL